MKKPAEIVLPLIVIAVVGIMVVPMPRLILDCLLTLNIAFSLLLFVFCFFLDSAKKLTVLPAVLLLVTVLRLSLNIATTRQILSGNDVPEIVRTFGELAVGGSIAVGMVVFV
ncbi:MAG: FHIPEP family type III secretion protein, partial [bacterium]|nr:FHIPEP family type III secretion protein [bacterium]